MPESSRISDYARPATSLASDKARVDDLKARFGSTATSDVSAYEVEILELSVFYFADNLAGEHDNYRAIPRLKFSSAQPGDKDGKLATFRAVT